MVNYVTDSLSFSGDEVKATVPRALYLAILRIQAADSSDWTPACTKAAALIDSGSERFKKMVRDEVNGRLNSELLTRVNRARKTIEVQAFERAKQGYEIWYYCAQGGERITMFPNGKDHLAMIELMRANQWGHPGYHQRTQ